MRLARLPALSSMARRLIALVSSLLIVGACFAVTSAAFASPGESCHLVPQPQSRCDGSSDSFGHGLLVLPADGFQVPGPSVAGRLGLREKPDTPHDSLHGSVTTSAPPLA